MTSDGSETYANVFKMLRIPKIDYSFMKIGRISTELWPKQKIAQCPLKKSTKCGATPVKGANLVNPDENGGTCQVFRTIIIWH